MARQKLKIPTKELRVQAKEVGGKITTKGRRGLKRGQFALPDGKRPGQAGRFPIDTEARARNALARAAQGVKRGTLSSGEASRIRRAVARKFPGIEVKKRRA